MNKLLITSLAFALACAGCATGPRPQTSAGLYLIADPGTRVATPVRDEQLPSLVLRDVNLAGFLDNPGLVYQTDSNTVRVAANHRWAEPLTSQLQRQVYTDLSQQLKGIAVYPDAGSAPSQSVRLSVHLTGFHGRYDGIALVAGNWTLSDAGGEELVRQPFSYRVKLTDDGYDALVRALAQGLEQTTRDIAKGLNRFGVRRAGK